VEKVAAATGSVLVTSTATVVTLPGSPASTLLTPTDLNGPPKQWTGRSYPLLADAASHADRLAREPVINSVVTVRTKSLVEQ
jgi:hypothetical protein